MTRRILIGRDASGVQALRVTKVGVDVLGTPLAEDFLFNSDWSRMGIIHQDGVVSQLGTVVTFPALGFVPHVRLLRWDASIGKAFGDEAIGVLNPFTGQNVVQSSYWADNITNSQFTVTGSLNGANSNADGNPSTNNTASPRVFQYFVFRVPCVGI